MVLVPDYFYSYPFEGYNAILGCGPLAGGQGGRSEGLRSLTRHHDKLLTHTGSRPKDYYAPTNLERESLVMLHAGTLAGIENGKREGIGLTTSFFDVKETNMGSRIRTVNLSI